MWHEPVPPLEAINRVNETVTVEMLVRRTKRCSGSRQVFLDPEPDHHVFDSVPHFRGHTQEIIGLTRLQLGDAYKLAWTPTTPEQGAP